LPVPYDEATLLNVGQVPDIQSVAAAGRVGDDRVQHGSLQREKTALDARAILGLAWCLA